MHQIDPPSLENLPAPKLRQEMLRRAQLTLGEARALLDLLDQLEQGQMQHRARVHPLRAAIGLQLPAPRNHSRAR